MTKVTAETPELHEFFCGLDTISQKEEIPSDFTWISTDKYFRIVRDKGVYAFVKKSTGDVHAAASWNHPKSVVFSNIFDGSFGLSKITTLASLYG